MASTKVLDLRRYRGALIAASAVSKVSMVVISDVYDLKAKVEFVSRYKLYLDHAAIGNAAFVSSSVGWKDPIVTLIGRIDSPFGLKLRNL
jgi:hypothetical protein